MRGPESPGPLVVSGGTIVSAAGPLRADVVVEDGRIAALTRPGHAPSTRRSGRRIDAAGCFVLPGGVDPHCHAMGDVVAATRGAALGGTTTVLSFTNPEAGEDALACMLRCTGELGSTGIAVDVGLHAMLYEPDSSSVSLLEALKAAGVSGVKIFLAYEELGIMWSSRGLFELMGMAARVGQLVQVHCEEGEVIDSLVAHAIASGGTGPAIFAATRPAATESAAVSRVLASAAVAGAACYLVHISCSESLDEVRLGRAREGPRLFAEVCLHHLVLDDASYSQKDAERYLVAPPLRPRLHQESLWQGLADGTVDTVGSDHSQHRSRTIGALSPDGRGYCYGIAGVGARLPVLLSDGLARGLPLERIVEVAATNPARAFGHYPKKGVIAPGSDADLVIFEPGGETKISPGTFDDGTGDSVYSGKVLAGRIRQVLLRGSLVVEDGSCLVRDAGAYLPRGA